jgi:mannose-1-phosphate guanylyltransferase
MRYAVILAGGSGTRLWPMSRSNLPKQLLPFVNGRSLLDLSFSRLEGLVERDRRFVCAGEAHRAVVLQGLPSLISANFLGEPEGRDTLNAIAYASAVIARADAEAIVGVFTADAFIEPDDRFRRIVSKGYAIAEREPNVIVTFGIPPVYASTSFGYLRLGEGSIGDGRIVTQFTEKPDKAIAERLVSEGSARYLWNSGIFVFRTATFLECIRRFQPETHAGALRIARDWGTAAFGQTIRDVYPALPKISVDYAVMEPAARDSAVRVVAVPMDLTWTDIGSWPAFAKIRATDTAGNTQAAEQCILTETTGTLVISNDSAHVIAVVGCHDLIVVHTADATLVCSRDRAEDVKAIQTQVMGRFGARYV